MKTSEELKKQWLENRYKDDFDSDLFNLEILLELRDILIKQFVDSDYKSIVK